MINISQSDMPDDSQFEGVDSPADGADTSRRMEDIQKFADIIKGKRTDAIEGRRMSGIEKIWQEDEDHYEGIDKYSDRNQITKPRTMDGSFTQARKKVVGRSTAFANITRPYCDAASARVSDMLLPTDDRNWAARPTPVPELINSKDNMTPAVGPDGVPLMKPAPAAQQQAPGMMNRIGSAISGMFGGQSQPMAPQQQMPPPAVPVTVAELAEQIIAKAKKSADRAQTVMDDWLVECHYHAEVRKVIECTARLGVGILKGPHPIMKKYRAVNKTAQGWKLSMQKKDIPASLFVNPWNFYPDPNCGEYVQKGSYTLERDNITARGLIELKDLKDDKGNQAYISEMIDLCLKEGPISSVTGVRKLNDTDKLSEKELFEIWYFYGQVSKKDMEAAGCKCDFDGDDAPCMVTMVNDRIIKITMSVLDSGEFPYDVMVWQEKIGHWAGVGVARQMRTCQKGLNSAIRALMDNMAISSGPQIIVDTSKLEPADGNWTIRPNKLWRKKLNAESMDDVRSAFTIISIETRQGEIMNVIQLWGQKAEEITGLPMLMQGQQGQSNPTDKVGIANIMNNNSGTVLRRIARIFDDRITEPHIGRYYEWLMLHGPEDAKGDYTIDARGSSALVERDLQNQAMMQLLGASINPAYVLDPEKVMKEVLKGMRLDPKSFTMDDDKRKAMAEQKPPEDPRITAAKIMAESRGKDLQTRAQSDASLLSMKLDAEKAAHDVDVRLAMDSTTSEEKRDLDQIKAMLAAVTIKLQVQERLSKEARDAQRRTTLAGHTVDLHKHNNPQVITPASEPVGRAEAGEAFTQ